MKNLVVSLLAVVVLVLSFQGAVQAQVGVGFKVPPLVLPNFFVSYMLDEHLMLEGAASLSVFGAASSISAGANAKLFFDAVEIADLSLKPFVGAGANLSLISVNVMGFGSTVMAIGVNGLAGMEYQIPDTSLNIFLELGVGISLQPVGFGIGGAIGARYDFDLE